MFFAFIHIWTSELHLPERRLVKLGIIRLTGFCTLAKRAVSVLFGFLFWASQILGLLFVVYLCYTVTPNTELNMVSILNKQAVAMPGFCWPAPNGLRKYGLIMVCSFNWWVSCTFYDHCS